MVGEETHNKFGVFHLESITHFFNGRTSFHKSPKFLAFPKPGFHPQFAPTPSIGAIQHINKKYKKTTLQGTNISNLWTWKIMDSKVPLKGNILVPRRISIAQLLRSQHQTPSMQPKRRWGRKHKHFDYPYKTVLGKSPVEQRSGSTRDSDGSNPVPLGWLKSCKKDGENRRNYRPQLVFHWQQNPIPKLSVPKWLKSLQACPNTIQFH